jgi:hypothetical protein
MTDAILGTMNYNLFLAIVILISVLDVCYARKRHSHGIMHTGVDPKVTDTGIRPKALFRPKVTDTGIRLKVMDTGIRQNALAQSVKRDVPIKQNTLGQHITSYAQALVKV